MRLSILDLAPLGRGESASDSFAASVVLAQRAEELGGVKQSGNTLSGNEINVCNAGRGGGNTKP